MSSSWPRMRETVLLCISTRRAISVRLSCGSATEKACSTRMPFCSTDSALPSVALLPLLSVTAAGLLSHCYPGLRNNWCVQSTTNCTHQGDQRSSATDDVVLRTVAEPCDVLGAVLRNDENVVLAVAACP